MSETETALKRVSDDRASRDRDVKTLERQLETRAYEMQELKSERDIQNDEIRKLQSDLGEITHESQVTHESFFPTQYSQLYEETSGNLKTLFLILQCANVTYFQPNLCSSSRDQLEVSRQKPTIMKKDFSGFWKILLA